VHDHAELFLMLSGANTFRVTGQQVRVKQGQALLMPPGVPHRERVEDGAEAPFRMLVLSADRVHFHYINGIKGKPDFPIVGAVITSPNLQPRGVQELFSAAIRFLRAPSGASVAVSVMASLLDCFLEGLRQMPQEEWRGATDFSARVLAVVRSHYVRADCNVAGVAHELGISPNYLSARFRNETGMRLGDLILQERLEQSRHLLETGNLSVADVAQRSGFRDATYFIRCFRTAFGNTPLQYRKQKQEPA
jgi:AraC-like DNA-binding protein